MKREESTKKREKSSKKQRWKHAKPSESVYWSELHECCNRTNKRAFLGTITTVMHLGPINAFRGLCIFQPLLRNSHTHFIAVLLNIIYVSIYILYHHHHRQYNKQRNTFSLVENAVTFPLFYTTSLS
jgi:hypothetical protein